MSTFIGITISKDNLVLNDEHLNTLNMLNIGVSEQVDHYILYYKPKPYTDDPQTICHLKGILTRIGSDQIYNAYNNDFGDHITRTRPVIKIKMNTK